MRFGLLLILIGTLTSHCAIAPFATDKSGTSLGKGVNYLDLGLSPLPYAHYAHGITDSFDAGGIFELQFGYTAALYGKYSLLDNAEDGVSVAAVAGGGVGVSGFLDTTYLFVGPTVSYRQKKIEFFIHPRFTHVRYDDIEPDDTTSWCSPKIVDTEKSVIHRNLPNSTSFQILLA